jgi:NADH-quinone oxidoreductase subunit L
LFLIGFWAERSRALKAVLKVFYINKFGDFLLFFSFCTIFSILGSGDFSFLAANLSLLGTCTFSYTDLCLATTVGLIIILGSGVKSAQFGFHVWLLEAMEAPLGASALMHSSTLVIAGVVLLWRLRTMLDLFSNLALFVFL